MQTPPPEARVGNERLKPRIVLAVIVVVLLLLVASARALAVLFTDKLWFDDLGFGAVFNSLIWARITPALIFGSAMTLVLWINLIIADRVAPQYRTTGAEDELIERYTGYISPYMGRVQAAISIALGVLVGIGSSGQWREWLLFRNRVTWGVKDAQFGKDIGFYVFELPFWKFVAQWLFLVLFVTFVFTTLFHYLRGGIRVQSGYQRVTPHVKAHLSALLALLTIVKTVQYWLGRYDLVFSHRGKVDGASYTDIHAQLPALEFLALISVVGALMFIVNIWRRGWTLPVIAVALWAFISLVIGTAYPAYMQRFRVQPSELAKERTYIARNIDATRAAYALDGIEVETYDGAAVLDRDAIASPELAATLSNIRLWDPGVLNRAIQGSQSIKGYYKFSHSVSDRYRIDGERQFVMLAVRGLNAEQIPSDSWTNRHLAYTHGQGAVVVDANSTTSEKTPRFEVKDIPAVGPDELAIAQPDVYFSPELKDFVIAGSKEKEIEVDGSGNEIRDSYKGERGIEMSSFLRRAAFAVRFGDVNVALSGRVTPDSKLLFVRDIRERVEKAAPFLTTDSKPYPVILPDGSLQWVLDAYTTTDRYPYSQEIRSGDIPGVDIANNVNYARNSVKAVVNAYDGSVTLYAIDEQDPLLRAYRKAFPSLFREASEIPAALAEHLRYPSDMFRVQTQMLERYHLESDSTDAFYRGTDQWRITPQQSEDLPEGDDRSSATTTTPTTAPRTNDGGRSSQLASDAERSLPNYLMMQLPGESGQQFVLTSSFVPFSSDGATSNRLAAFVAVRNDGFAKAGGRFGAMTVYKTGSKTQLDSELFAASQIQKDSEISSRLSLLSQRGSKVTRGAVQLLPIGDSILYAQPFFIRSEDKDSLPSFEFIAMSYRSKAVFATSVEGALAKLFPGDDNESPPDSEALSDAQRLAAAAKAWKAWQKAVGDGDFDEASKQLAQLDALLAGGAGGNGGTTTTTSPNPTQRPPTASSTSTSVPSRPTTTTTPSTADL